MIDWLDDSRVALVRERPGYARTPPFAPSEAFPEWPELAPGREDNPAYRAVRLVLYNLGFDASRFGTPAWNPLGDLARPGETIAIKPNFVADRNERPGAGSREDFECLVTHGSFVRAVIDYAAKALKGRGRILVGDCPIQQTRWPRLSSAAGLDTVLADAARRFPGIDIVSRDYRLVHSMTAGGQVRRERGGAGPERYQELDLRRDSLLLPLMEDDVEFAVANYPRIRMRRAHTRDSNLYIVPRDLLEADLFINLPKMKSHQKAGITGALKNLVGVIGHKDYLPHFRFGSPSGGGDEYPDGGPLWDLHWRFVHACWENDRGAVRLLARAAVAASSQVHRRALGVDRTAFAQGGGSWHGNDTLWRTILDVNRAFLYYDRDRSEVGEMPSRRHLALLDGLIGGDHESPLAPSPVPAGLALGARNPVALDTVAATVMGFDFRRLHQVARAYELQRYPLVRFDAERIAIHGPRGIERLEDIARISEFVRFIPSCGWKGHIEFDG